MSAPLDVGSSGNPAETGEGALSHEIICPNGAYKPPVPFAPNEHFQFNTSERCEREFQWSTWNTTGVTFETPPSYNSTFANISFRVSNTTIETTTIIDQAGSDGLNAQQSQGFETTQGIILQGFSIYIYSRPQAVAHNWSVRSDSYMGPILSEVSVTLPTSGNQWYYIGLPTPVFLAIGHYYIYAPALGGSSSAKWMRSGTGASGDCYANTGGWQLQDRNLTLKIHAKTLVDPESVQMNISDQVYDQSVLNLGEGAGWANFTRPITGKSINFSISNSSPIEYSYSGHLTSFRDAKSLNEVNLTNGNANWTLTAFSYPGPTYSVYQGNITGFNENHTAIQAFLGQNAAGFSRPPPFNTLIFSSEVDRITFLSTNYITRAEIPSEVHSNQDIDLNVTVGDLGNVSVNIYSDTGSVYENKTYASGTSAFHWHVETALAAGEYTFETVFSMPNHVGFFQQNITIVKVAAIENYTLRVNALDILRLNYRIFDLYAGSNIDGANVNYYFKDLTGSLDDDSIITHNYTKNINLETYSIRPGSYDLFLDVSKAGYQSILVSMPVEIVDRQMILQIARSATTLNPGNTLELTITTQDLLTGGDLVRPVDLTIKIYPAGGDADVDAIMSGTLESLTAHETLSVTIPATVALGAYDILVIVNSNYYEGSKVIPSGLVIEEPPNALFSTLIVVGIGMVGSGTYIQRKKVQTRRSVKGAFLMNPGGTLIEERISRDFSNMNPHLISGAVMGIVSMVREMTGKAIHTIALEGRYLKFLLHDSFWVVLIMQKNPAWISATIKHLVDEIEERYGAQLKAWKGENNVRIPLDDMLLRWFGVEIRESRDPTLELESRETAETRAIESGSSIGNENPKKD